jgi:predicted aspartyl protease
VIDTYLEGQTPNRRYEQIGVIRGHYASPTVWGQADIANLLPELHAKARELGADAILITQAERYRGPALNPLYRTIPNIEVTALALRYLSAESLPSSRERTPSSSDVRRHIPLVKTEGVYAVPVQVNDVLILHFVLDSGAAEILIPADVALTLYRTGTIQPTDFLPGGSYTLADGSVIQSPRFIIRRLSLGGHLLTDIPASIGNVSSFPLLGQSLLERLGAWGIDNTTKTLVFNPLSSPDVFLTIAGNWQGQWRSKAASAGGDLVSLFQQSERELTGEITITASGCFTRGAVVGTLLGDSMLLRAHFGGEQWVDLSGTLDHNQRSIVGQYVVNGGRCGGDRGVWELRR